MPVSLQDYKRKTKEVTIDFGDGDTLTVTYRPSVMTPEWESKLRAEAKAIDDRGDAGADIWAHYVAELVADWDLYQNGTKGSKVPLKVPALREVPTAFLRQVMSAIAEDMVPKPKRDEQSGNGSFG